MKLILEKVYSEIKPIWLEIIRNNLIKNAQSVYIRVYCRIIHHEIKESIVWSAHFVV